MHTKYDSSINVLGSIPDYITMMEFICEYLGTKESSESSFSFRTHKTFNRFLAAIKSSILNFANTKQQEIFISTLNSENFTVSEKLLVLYWQMAYGNNLFRKISEDVYMKALYQGRSSLSSLDVLSLLHHLKEIEPEELQWSEQTLKTSASKYLTILKKLGLADGKSSKEFSHPVITNQLFVYFIKWMLYTVPQNRTQNNPFMVFSFIDKKTFVSRLKKVEYLSLWNINQIGEDVTIDLIENE